jgi:hypothetical protein
MPISSTLRRAFVCTGSALLVAAISLTVSAAESDSSSGADAIAALRAENEHLRTLIPSQSHAMMDVAYHFTNLWFAGNKRNWPLAQFYFNEARSHIQWAVRLVPVRKSSHGEVHLEEMFAAFDGTLLTDLKSKIAAKDAAGFKTAYKAALAGCNSCHTASEKPFLKITIPKQQEVQIVDFDAHD